MILVKEEGDKYRIRFQYDANFVNVLRNVPSRMYHPQSRTWTIDKTKLGFLLNLVKGTIYDNLLMIQSSEDINRNESMISETSIPDVSLRGIKYYVKEGAKPYQHQKDFMKYAIHRQKTDMSGFIVGDEQGLAKTNESMNLAIYNRRKYKFKHCLVICCVNSSKYNWKRDIYQHTRGEYDPYILGSRRKRDGSIRCNTGSKEKLKDIQTLKMFGKDSGEDLPYFIIVNIEAFRQRTGKRYQFTEEIIKLINLGEINMIIIDEFHKNMSPKSSQGKQIIKIKSKTDNKAMWIPMSGTPITSKPTDLFNCLRLVDAHTCDSYWWWSQDYCIFGGFNDKDVIAYKNIPKLKAMLQDNMIRRLKSKVLDLPPKIRYTEYVENTPYQESLYKKTASELKCRREKIITSFSGLSEFIKLRQVNGSPELVDPKLVVNKEYFNKNAKLRRCIELVDEIVERGEKVVIFSNWVEPLRTLYKFVSCKYNTCCFTGTMTDDAREKNKRVFQTNPEYPVMIGTIGALGTTHTLTAACNIIFYDEPWTASDKEQAEDRLHRIGQKSSSINIYTLITKDTVDDKVHDIVYTKDGISKFIVDDLDIRSNPELFDLLIGRV